jgi:hypothetical protein
MSMKSKVEKRNISAVEEPSIMAPPQKKDEDEKFCTFLAEKMRCVAKQDKTAAQMALLRALDVFL